MPIFGTIEFTMWSYLYYSLISDAYVCPHAMNCCVSWCTGGGIILWKLHPVDGGEAWKIHKTLLWVLLTETETSFFRKPARFFGSLLNGNGLICFIHRFHHKDVLDLQWSHDSAFLVSASVDNTCIIWEASKGDSRHSTESVICSSMSSVLSCVIDIWWFSQARCTKSWRDICIMFRVWRGILWASILLHWVLTEPVKYMQISLRANPRMWRGWTLFASIH